MWKGMCQGCEKRCGMKVRVNFQPGTQLPIGDQGFGRGLKGRLCRPHAELKLQQIDVLAE